MDDIAKGMGISKKTIYSHFVNKKTLILESVKYFSKKDECDTIEIAESSRDAIDEMISIARHMMKMLRKMSPSLIFDLQKYYPEAWDVVNLQHYRFIYSTIRMNIERGINEGYYRKDINSDIISKFYVQLSHNVVNQDIFPPLEYGRTQLFKQLIRYHLNSILSPKGIEYVINLELV
jgi:AcrR family transcriptional regulator